MDQSEIIPCLRNRIQTTLTPLIDRDYWLLGVPHHTNIGDYLIWQGEMDFLSGLPLRCKGISSEATFDWPEIPESEMILINGGGSFGDVWPECFNFMIDVIERYTRNKILFFPQTVHFVNAECKIRAIRALRERDNVIVCVRDKRSMEELETCGCARVLLVPDMAFAMNTSRWVDRRPQIDLLRVVRADREVGRRIGGASSEAGLSDWPHMNRWDPVVKMLEIINASGRVFPKAVDFVFNHGVRPLIIRSGITFVSRAREIHTMRLHAGILGMLLSRRVVLYDNSYGKLSRFYDTWLAGCKDVEVVQ